MKENKSKVRKKPKKNSKSKKNTKKHLKISKRGLLTITMIFLLLVLILIIMTNSFLNKNNLDRVSNKLRMNLNKSITDVEKNTKIDFFQSASSDLLCNLQSFDYVTEPSSNVEVLGTNLPKWIVYVKTNKSGLITQYTMYDFQILSTNILGYNNSNKIIINGLVGLSEENLISSIGFKPYIRKFMIDGSKQIIFRYNYQEEKTKNSICIQLTFDLDTNNLVTKATETSVNYLNDILSLVENTDNTTNDNIVIGTS